MKQFISLLMLAFIYGGTSSQTLSDTSNYGKENRDIPKEYAEKILPKLELFPRQTELSIAIYDGTKTHFYGMKKTKKGIEIIENRAAVFEAGSITKVFTTHLMMKARDKNLLTLDQAISEAKNIPEISSATISFSQLANHTSGLPSEPSNFTANIFNYKNPFRDYGEEEMLEYLAGELEEEAAPGTRYKYSNLGMGLLGYLLSEMNGKSYEALIQQEILQPLEMLNSTTDLTKLKTRLVQGHSKRGKDTPNWDFDALAGAGALKSTTADLMKYAKYQLNALDGELKEMKEASFQIRDDFEVGLGWHIYKNKTEAPLHWHNGGTRGYKSCMALNTELKQAVVILSNVSSKHEHKREIDNLCFELMSMLGNF